MNNESTLNVPCSFITGIAGSGKTYSVKQRIETDPTWAILGASTGVAGVNLNTSTIHSILGFYNLESLRDSFFTGRLQRKIKEIVNQGYQNIVIDEVSMLGGEMLDIILMAMNDINNQLSSNLGLIIVGDALQLPPVKSKWFFESDYWPLFEANTTRLTKIWRQSDERFLNALNLARMGDGAGCFDALTNDCSVALHTTLDDSFQGTTILGKNEEVNRYNQYRLSRMSGQSFSNSRIIKGLALREWEKHIPLQQTFKVGAYVMILHNYYEDTLKGKELVYANGDTAYIKEVIGDSYIVELVRNKKEVLVTRIERHNTRVSKPFDEEIKRIKFEHDYDVEQVQVGGQKLWSLGYVNYMPLMLSWASSCHRSQGLTLDRVQYDLRDYFTSHPGLSYVALSRCRSAEGLRLVGNRELFKRRIKVDPKVARFI